ncbi:ABC transporter substrate-binding protein [Xanthobacter dioxanivorans]|nr:ABC transporter substrate-binding protein [Xanthobacter dioxanivorans]
MKRMVMALALLASAGIGPAAAGNGAVKIGVLSDMAGIYSDISGAGALIAAQLAVEDFGGKALGKPIELVSADHQTKPDVGLAIARRWIDSEGVDAIVDVPVSSIGLAIQALTLEKDRIFLNSSGAASDFTGKACSPLASQWPHDTYIMGTSVGRAVVQSGGKRWFFLTADYVFGHNLERDTMAAVKKAGGTVLGSARHPLNTQDFSSFLLQAQSSKADVIGLANAAGDTTQAIKQASEFGLSAGGTRLAATLLFITDVHAMGLKIAQGTVLTEPFYWDLDDSSRAWSKRFMARIGGKAPGTLQASVYSSVLHYLKAVEKVGSTDARKVSEAMKEMRISDALIKDGYIRADGRVMRDYYLFQIKAPEESKYPWDYYKLILRIPPEEVTRPLSEGGCPLVTEAKASPAR